ncbi:MAG: thioredoxin domain-containing protein [archaeon]
MDADAVDPNNMKLKFLIIMLLLLISIALAACNSGPGKYDEFAACLFEKEVTMYGTEWCSHCQNQKAEFEKSFKYVDFVDCDKNKDACLRAGVEGYPTWKINGTLYPGEQPLERLASLSGCELNNEQ